MGSHFPDQELNMCPLQCKADSTTDRQGSPFLSNLTPSNVRTDSWAELNQPILMSWAWRVVNNIIILSIKGKNMHPSLNFCKSEISDYAGWIQIWKVFSLLSQVQLSEHGWKVQLTWFVFPNESVSYEMFARWEENHESPRVKLCQCGHSSMPMWRLLSSNSW